MTEGVFWVFREVVFNKVRLYLAIMLSIARIIKNSNVKLVLD